MTPEEKQLLLLKVLSEMLPYGIKVLDNSHKNYGASNLINIGVDGSILIDNEINDIQYYPIISEIKPYLRSMSSMTKEEKMEYFSFIGGERPFDCDFSAYPIEYKFVYEQNVNSYIDWLNKHHFDYRGLIEKGLAIKVTEENNPYEL